jgi:hypothetical protein
LESAALIMIDLTIPANSNNYKSFHITLSLRKNSNCQCTSIIETLVVISMILFVKIETDSQQESFILLQEI